MRLVRYKATNFRSVDDSGWIDAERVTALIGVNESGKTNLLLPLWKLNPAREGEINPTSDYPKSIYKDIRLSPGSYRFVTAEFDCAELAQAISEVTALHPDVVSLVQVSRYFDGRREYHFPRHNARSRIPDEEVKRIIGDAKDELETLSSLTKEGSLKEEFIEALSKAAKRQGGWSGEEIKGLRDELAGFLPESPASTSTLVPRYQRALDMLSTLNVELQAPLPGEIEAVKNIVESGLPRFVYYSNYGNLDSEIYLPHVVANLKRSDLGAREEAKARTLRVLFDFVSLPPDEILELGRDFRDPQNRRPTEPELESIATKKRERTILLNSASTDLTKKFRDWWRQGDYAFEFQADGDHFRIWVSDSKRPEKIELEDRSSGLQWFLSFYLIFLVESRRDHRDAILLLDEPGLSLHPLAQRDLSQFFDSLADTNQILFTTHSPFLVDADSLDRARKVFMAPDGSTKASSDLRRGSEDPRKNGATYAIYSALNMNVAESMLFGCQPVVVEGPSDQHYLTAIKSLLISGNKISPKRELVFPPSHGARNAKVIASIISGRDEVLPVMLFDGDAAGRDMARDMQNGPYQESKDRVLTTDAFVGFTDSEVEDLFPQDFLAEVVDRWERGPDTRFSDVLVKGQPIVPQIEAWASGNSVVLRDGWKVELSRQVKKQALKVGVGHFDANTVDRWTKLFNEFSI